MKRHRSYIASPAFTVVELLIVIVVIAILVTLSVVAFNNVTGRAGDASLLSSASSIGKKIVTATLATNQSLPANKASFLSTTGLEESASTTYQYTLNTTVKPNIFCLTVTQDSKSSHISGSANATNQPVTGPCVSYGHTGNPPDLSSLDCPNDTTWVKVPGSSLFNQDHFCVMKYEAKKVGNDTGTGAYNSAWVPESRATGTPWVSISQEQAIAESKTVCDGCHLMTESQWLTIAHNVMSQEENWIDGVVGSTSYLGAGGGMFKGHDDNSPVSSLAASTNDSNGYEGTGQTSGSQRRTYVLSNDQVIWDLSGNVYELTSGTIASGKPGLAGDSSTFVWRQYTTADMLWGILSYGVPAYGTPTASSWNSLNNIGSINTTYANSVLVAIARGGSWNVGTVNGLFGATLSSFLPSSAGGSAGFRVAK